MVGKFPDTPAAQLAQKRLDALGVPAISAGPCRRDRGRSRRPVHQDRGQRRLAGRSKRAFSYLRMAKTFSAARPEKAKSTPRR